ncbi:hypothetical protein PAL_GLEAN10023026 [Pteropus alecto]|uniref:Uncharacterized protein n=1 Tax=Pteropus alecto TaxID=9402 RepID=L5K543_PTEAL|nr:hypothetical protein PAL_GLEAN10023026 [Pteropus alecto]
MAPPGGEDGKCRRHGKVPCRSALGLRSHAADGNASFVFRVRASRNGQGTAWPVETKLEGSHVELPSQLVAH